MRIKIFAIISFLTVSVISSCQSTGDINKTDQFGKKQGLWIKKYPGGTVQYEGTFKDDHPAGVFKRYYENHTIKSTLVYSEDGKQADATFYHPNGFISSKGKYIDQLKEGKWMFYSEITRDYLVGEDEYLRDLLNGISVRYFLNGNIAESLKYVNGKKDGEWNQFYENGKIALKTYYKKGILDGKLEIWFENGQPKFTGLYKNNVREGKWIIHNEDGSLKYEVNYVAGVSDDNPMEAEAAAFIESLEKNKDKVADPEKNR